MTGTSLQDAITREIEVDAPRAVVRDLVSVPGWWINDGTITDNTIEEKDGVLHVTNVTHGTFRLVPEDSADPERVAFRWLPREEDEARQGTLVEFTVTGPEDGPVTVRVVESGFASLGSSPATAAAHFRENSEGWDHELSALRTRLEAR